MVVTERKKREHGAWIERGETGDGRLVLTGDVRHARLHGSVWTGLGAEDAHLFKVDFGASRLERSTFKRCRIEASSFLLARFPKSIFEDVIFEEGRLGVSKAAGVKFERCKLVGAELDRSRWPEATLVQVDLSHSSMRRMKLERARFFDCNLANADLSEAVFDDTRFERCDLGGATLPDDISGAEFIDCIGKERS